MVRKCQCCRIWACPNHANNEHSWHQSLGKSRLNLPLTEMVSISKRFSTPSRMQGCFACSTQFGKPSATRVLKSSLHVSRTSFWLPVPNTSDQMFSRSGQIISKRLDIFGHVVPIRVCSTTSFASSLAAHIDCFQRMARPEPLALGRWEDMKAVGRSLHDITGNTDKNYASWLFPVRRLK